MQKRTGPDSPETNSAHATDALSLGLMPHLTFPHIAILIATWIIAGLATVGVILRPFRVPQWLWAVGGAALLVVCGLLPIKSALAGIGKGTDVYLFLFGMMLLAEVARQEGLFDWLAEHAARAAKGSAVRLFLLIYGVGTIVTTFLSNDATAVVLTPAVAASMKAANVKEPLPYLLICALIANAASFVLPISNPANLVIYGSHMPSLLQWLPRYALASVLSIGVTYLVLRWTQRKALRQKMAEAVDVPSSRAPARPRRWDCRDKHRATHGFGARFGARAADGRRRRVHGCCGFDPRSRSAWTLLRDISWGVLPLVAGLFVLVEALDHRARLPP